MTWHQFRHIHSSLLNDLNVPVKIAQEQLGHASITTTLAELEQTGGLVRQRGGIDLCDHAALERRTCECYQIIASEYGYLNRGGLYEHRIPAASELMRTCLNCF